jgi:TonB family protein
VIDFLVDFPEKFLQRLWMSTLFLSLVVIPGHTQQYAQPTDTPVPIDQWSVKKINPPQALSGRRPDFPLEARPRHINGCCLIVMTIDTDGMPQNIRLVRCSDPVFEKNSLDAVKQYRYKPATTHDGKPVSVEVPVEMNFQMVNGRNPTWPIHYRISSPPGITSPDPDAAGIYPLTKLADPPILTKFSSMNYGSTAFQFLGNGSCDIVLTISEKGKPYDAYVTECEQKVLENPAVESLLDSQYKPGIVNGKAVPMRVSIHLEYGASTKVYPAPELKTRSQDY